MRTRGFLQERSTFEVGAASPEDAWKILAGDSKPVERRLQPGDVLYVGDLYLQIDGDGGWHVLNPGDLTRSLHRLIGSELPGDTGMGR